MGREFNKNQEELIYVGGNLVLARLLKTEWGVAFNYKDDIYSGDVNYYSGGVRRFYDVACEPLSPKNKALLEKNGIEPLTLTDDEFEILKHREKDTDLPPR